MVDVWVSADAARPSLDPQAFTISEDGYRQPKVEIFPAESQPVGLAIVLSNPARLNPDWLLDVMLLLIRTVPDTTWATAALCSGSQIEMVAPTRDLNHLYNSVVQAQEHGYFKLDQPCDLVGAVNRALGGLASQEELQSATNNVVILGAEPVDAVSGARTWFITPTATGNPPRDEHHVIVTDAAASVWLKPLANALAAQSKAMHLRYRSGAEPGEHVVTVAAPSYGPAETIVIIPVIPPEIKLRNPETATFSATQTITLSIDIIFQQSPLREVSFFVDDRLIGTTSVAPYQLRWQTSGLAGKHTLWARATDQHGGTANTAGTDIEVQQAAVINEVPVTNQRLLLFSIMSACVVGLGALLWSGRARRRVESPVSPSPGVATVVPFVHLSVAGAGTYHSLEPIQRLAITVGSDPTCALVVIPDRDVAPLHLTLWQQKQGIVVQPHYPVRWNGQTVADKTLFLVGAELQVGTTMLRLDAIMHPKDANNARHVATTGATKLHNASHNSDGQATVIDAA